MYTLVLYFGLKMAVVTAIASSELTSYEACQTLAIQLKGKLPVRLGPVRWECKTGHHAMTGYRIVRD